jgi:hypothetical protein
MIISALDTAVDQYHLRFEPHHRLTTLAFLLPEAQTKRDKQLHEPLQDSSLPALDYICVDLCWSGGSHPSFDVLTGFRGGVMIRIRRGMSSVIAVLLVNIDRKIGGIADLNDVETSSLTVLAW